MELLRSLGSLIEPPSQETRRLADLLELDPLPEATEHTDLFLLQLYPFASVYLGSEGQLGGEARDRIAGFWRALDLSPPPEPDHLTVLLAFYSQLHDHQLASDAEDHNRWRLIRAAFLWEHLMSWLPVYIDKLRDLDPPFYRDWAELLVQALRVEVGDLPPPADLPLHLREAPPLNDPRQGEGDSFLEALLSPVRSGLILVRSDLARAGLDLQLAVRKGERRYVLKALLGQDDQATLQWLAAEARRWADHHQTWAPITGPIASFWSDRASSTAALLEDLAEDL